MLFSIVQMIIFDLNQTLAAGRLNSMKTRKIKPSAVAHYIMVILTLRRLRQDSYHKTQAIPGKLVGPGVRPLERKRTAHVPWNSWQGTVHSTLRCERPDVTRNLQQDGSAHQLPAVLASATVTSELSQLPSRPPCPPDRRMQPHEFTDTPRVASGAGSPVTGPSQAHHCRVFSKSFFSSGKTTNLCRST